jgi:hypothetical protein
VTEAEKEVLNKDVKDVDKEKKDEDFKPNIFENVNAATGKKIDNFVIEDNDLDQPS